MRLAAIALFALLSTTRREEKLLFVQVRVAGHGPYWFCVDSGAPHSVIDPAIARQLGLKVLRSSSTTGTGEGAVPVDRTVGALRMTAGTASVVVPEPWVIDLSKVPIPKWVHGLVGAEFFEQYAVEVDPDAPAVRFLDRATFKPPAGAAAIPIEADNHRFFMRLRIDVKPGESVEHRLRIDTGSGDSIDDEVVKDGRDLRETTIGRGLGHDFKASSGRVDAVHVGPFTIRDVWGPAAPHPAIGMEIFRRFTTTFDVSRGVVYLLPNRHIAEPVPAPRG